MRVEDSFLFGYAQLAGVSADERFDVIYHNQVLRTVSWIVVVLIAGAVVAAWLARKKRNVIWMPLVVIGAAVSILQLRWTDGVWRLAPELKFLQFPWRWMMVLGLVFAALAGLALRGEAATRRAIAVRAALMLLLAGGMAVLSSLLFWQPCDDEDNVQAQIATFHEAGFEGTDEYTPQGADNGEIQQGLPQVRLLKSPNAEQASDGNNSQWTSDPSEEIAADVKVDRWNSERKSVTIVTAQPAYAVLRLMDYPAWRVTRNGAVVSERARRGDGLMAIPIAAGTNHIDVRWRTTGDQWAGIGISLAALAITLVLWLKGRRRIDGSGFR